MEYNFIPILLHLLVKQDNSSILAIHLETLKSLMYGEGKCVALDFGAFEIFVIPVSSNSSFCLSLLQKVIDRPNAS